MDGTGSTAGAAPSSAAPASYEQVAWLAGLLEGEGSFLAWRRARGGMSLRIQFATTDRDVLERAAAIMDAKIQPSPRTVRTPLTDNPKPLWIAHLSRRCEAAAWMRVLREWMGDRRRQQIDKALDLHEAWPHRC